MTRRYIAACSFRPDHLTRIRSIAFNARRMNLKPLLETPRLVVFASEELPFLRASDGRSLILGSLFMRDSNATVVDDLNRQVGSGSIGPCGDGLTSGYWGAYISIQVQDDAIHMLRDPSGALPCYRSHQDDLHLIFSDPDLAFELDLISNEIDWGYVAHHLTYQGLRPARTGLLHMLELLGGEAMSLRATGISVNLAWSPSSFVTPEKRIVDREHAASLVREETLRCVSAMTRRSNLILQELSGGLDSSLISASLAQTSYRRCAVNLVTPDPSADERRYARATAAATDVALVEIPLSVADADLTKRPSARLARPMIGVLQQIVDDALLRVAAELGVDAFISGGGGDSLFGYVATAAPAADVFRTQGLGAQFFRSVRDLSILHNCTLWKAGRLSIQKIGRKPRPWPFSATFLAKDAIPCAPEPHPWLSSVEHTLDGSREHLMSILGLQNSAAALGRASWAPVHYPFRSQPLMETCLQIPSWLWIEGGQNRAVAREAFKNLLPSEVIVRRTKGNFSPFCGAIYEANRDILRDILVGGILAKEGIIDEILVHDYLSNPTPPGDSTFFRLLDLSGVEIWARSWKN